MTCGTETGTACGVTNFPLCAVSVLWSSVEFCDCFLGSSKQLSEYLPKLTALLTMERDPYIQRCLRSARERLRAPMRITHDVMHSSMSASEIRQTDNRALACSIDLSSLPVRGTGAPASIGGMRSSMFPVKLEGLRWDGFVLFCCFGSLCFTQSVPNVSSVSLCSCLACTAAAIHQTSLSDILMMECRTFGASVARRVRFRSLITRSSVSFGGSTKRCSTSQPVAP